MKTNEKSEFESRIEFNRIRIVGKIAYEATVYWNNRLYEATKLTKELCVNELKRKANIID